MKYITFLFISASWILLSWLLLSCTSHKENSLGNKEKPIQFMLIPAQDTKTIEENGVKLKKWLEKDTGLFFEMHVPVSYVAVIEAFGTKRADLAIINTFGYILANEKYQAHARLILINRGRDEYNGQIISRKDGLKSIKEINGKKFAFVDPASTSGFLLAQDLFEKEKIKPSQVIFTNRHENVVSAVYNKQVDAGATFYTPPDENGEPKDARWLLRTQYPDVYEKVQILQLTGPIPNDPLVFRNEFPLEIENRIAESLKKYIKTDEGKNAMMGMYHITDFKDVNDDKYDKMRSLLKSLGKKTSDFIK